MSELKIIGWMGGRDWNVPATNRPACTPARIWRHSSDLIHEVDILPGNEFIDLVSGEIRLPLNINERVSA